MMKRLSSRIIAGLVAGALLSGYARAAVEMEMVAVAGDVILTASGTLNLTSTSNIATAGSTAVSAVDASGNFSPSVVAGLSVPTEVRVECAVLGPTTFGDGTDTWKADEGSGDTLGIYGLGESYGAAEPGLCLLVPRDYVSGAQLMGSATFINSSLSSLGVTKGVYTWSWGAGDSADSLTLYIGGKPEQKALEVPTMTFPLTLILAVMVLLLAYKVGNRRSPR